MKTPGKIDHPEIVRNIFRQRTDSRLTRPCPSGALDTGFLVTDDISLSCRFYPAAADAPIVLFYPSPSVPAGSFDSLAVKYNAHGISLFLMSYRGHMGNRGTPSITHMFSDCNQQLRQAKQWLHEEGYTGSIFVMGHSLGSACAVDVVLRNIDSIKGLIIESGIYETAAFLRAVGVSPQHAAITEEEGLDIIRKIEKIKLPTLIFHGARDSQVSVAQAENLQSCSGAKSKQFYVIPGAERDSLPEAGGDLYFQTIKKHIDTVCGVNTWRQRRKRFNNNR